MLVGRGGALGTSLQELASAREADDLDWRFATVAADAADWRKDVLARDPAVILCDLDAVRAGEVVSALRMIKAHVQHNESIALFTLQRDAHEKRVHSGIDGIVDCIIELETKREKSEFGRYLIVKKIRNHPEKTGIFSYTIGDKGIVGV